MVLVVSSPRMSSLPRRMLKDFLNDLVESEVRNNRNSAGSTTCRRLSKSSKISNAIHKASRAVISSAVKLLPCKSTSANGSTKKTLLPISFSKNLFSNCLGKKASSKVLHSAGAASADKYQPPSNATTARTTITVPSASTTTSSTNRDAWSESESEFTQPLQNVDENGVVEAKKSKTSESIEAATTNTKKIGSNEGEEEQSSPVSVLNFSDDDKEVGSTSPFILRPSHLEAPVSALNFPDDDEQVGSSSPFTRRLSHLKETNKKLFEKLRRFECLSRMGKINHEDRVLPLVEDSEDGSPKLSFQASPSPLDATNDFSSIKEEESEEEVAEPERLLNLLKSKTPLMSNGDMLNNADEDALLIGFFQEGLAKASGKNCKLVEDTFLMEAEDWLCGQRSHSEASLGWKEMEKRTVYVKDVEEAREWKGNHDAEKEEVAIQVEAEILSSLVDEMVGELSNLELLKLLCY